VATAHGSFYTTPGRAEATPASPVTRWPAICILVYDGRPGHRTGQTTRGPADNLVPVSGHSESHDGLTGIFLQGRLHAGPLEAAVLRLAFAWPSVQEIAIAAFVCASFPAPKHRGIKSR
jgi:hypothetical protein